MKKHFLRVSLVLMLSALVLNSAPSNQIAEAASTNATSAAGDWGSWGSISTWPGLKYRMRCKPSGSEYTWDVEFRNDYNKKMHFSYELASTSESITSSDLSNRKTLDPGETDWGWELLPVRCGSGGVKVWAGKVRFGDDDDGPYAKP